MMKLKWNFKNMSKRNKMIAGILWKVVGLGGEGVHLLRAFAFPSASHCFQKRESFRKAFVATLCPLRAEG